MLQEVKTPELVQIVQTLQEPTIQTLPKRIPEIADPRLDMIYLEASIGRRGEIEGDYGFFTDIIKRTASGPKSILEVGCGAGHLSYFLAQDFPDANVVGVDMSQDSVSVASALYKKNNLKFQFGDVYRLEESHNDLDMIVIKNSLHHFNELPKALEQINRSLRQGGFLFVCDINREFMNSPGIKRNSLISSLVDFLRTAQEKTGQAYPDEKSVIDYLFRESSFISPNTASGIVTAMSLMAAYSPDEVKTALENTGFSDIYLTQVKHNYCAQARKSQ